MPRSDSVRYDQTEICFALCEMYHITQSQVEPCWVGLRGGELSQFDETVSDLFCQEPSANLATL